MLARAGGDAVKPIVGVTSVPKIAHSGFGDTPHESAPELYLDALTTAGATTVILPVHAEPDERLFSLFDGFLLTGGGDVDPGRYTGEAHERVYGVDDRRDAYEISLVGYAVDNDVPLLAICRGIQILNVALGGTLVVDIASQIPGSLKHVDLEHWTGTAHTVNIAAGSVVSKLVGEELGVNSMHHQGVATPGSGLVPVAWAPDGMVEAIELPDKRFIVGLQWHPECLGAGHPAFGIFEGFVEAAADEQG
jgi:putative glutamine amidotransferase